MIYQKRLLFILGFTFIVGCYNNAHIQTQRELKKGESSTNVSVIVPAYNSDERFETLIAAQRIEFSHLKGYENFELGYYGGIGNNIDWGFFPWALGGLIWRKNINNDFLPLKIGLHAEYGQFKWREKTSSVDEHRKYSGFQIRPSITTLTSSKKSSYFGAHGLLSASKRTENRMEIHSSLSNELTKEVEEENYNIYGFGLTGGWEMFSKSFSVQTQLDISMIKNAWEDFEYFRYESYDNKPKEGYTLSPLVSLSAGINFFNPLKIVDQAFTPLPNVEKTVIAIDDESVVNEPESYFFVETGPKSYSFFEQSAQKRIETEYFSPGELARKHMEEPTVHKFLAFMSPFMSSLGLFVSIFHTVDFKYGHVYHLNSKELLPYTYPFFGIVPYILSNRIAKNSRWLENESENSAYKKSVCERIKEVKVS